MFYKVELVIRKKNFYKTFQAGNSKGDIILWHSISQLDFGAGEFQISLNSGDWKVLLQEAYLAPYQTSLIRRFVKIAKNF